jgi:hypothetical protein
MVLEEMKGAEDLRQYNASASVLALDFVYGRVRFFVHSCIAILILW